jgi:carbamoyltransferase
VTVVLGISAHFHDSAAALVIDGRIAAAAEQERFSRIKHDASFPDLAIASCLAQSGLSLRDVDYVVFYEKPLIKFDRILETHLAMAPRSFAQFRRALPRWLGGRLNERRSMRRSLGKDLRGELLFVDHHAAHAASAFYPSPFDEAAILTADGVGEWSTTTIAFGHASAVEMLLEQRFPHSLGLLFNAFTHFLGFEVNEGEYKVMGLAPYGEPRLVEPILANLLDLKPDGSFRLNLDYFDFLHGTRMTSDGFERLFGPSREPGAPITRRDVDLAASLQAVTDEVFLRLARTTRERTGARRLCLAGGCAHNSVAAGKLAAAGIFDDVWVQPAAGDAGGALGAALYATHVLLGVERRFTPGEDPLRGAWLGPSFSDAELRAALAQDGAPFETPNDEPELLARVASSLAAGKVIGWFQGSMEYGPRALGARSILADPRAPDMTGRVNRSVKMREAFRPFAPAVLRDRSHEWFEVEQDCELPYMTFVVPVRAELLDGQPIARPTLPEQDGAPEHVLSAPPRGPIPAVTHVDGTARIQTVDARHGRYERLLRAFHAKTDCPVLLNTSFNVRGEPIVCTPQDALRCLRSTQIDLLVLGDHLVERPQQPSKAPAKSTVETPTRIDLRRFGLVNALALALLGGALSYHRDSLLPLLVLASLGLASAAACFFAPRIGRGLFRLSQKLAHVVGIVVGIPILALIYFALLTPLALARRIGGKDPLDRKLDPEATTYLRVKQLPADPARAFQTY